MTLRSIKFTIKMTTKFVSYNYGNINRAKLTIKKNKIHQIQITPTYTRSPSSRLAGVANRGVLMVVSTTSASYVTPSTILASCTPGSGVTDPAGENATAPKEPGRPEPEDIRFKPG